MGVNPATANTFAERGVWAVLVAVVRVDLKMLGQAEGSPPLKRNGKFFIDFLVDGVGMSLSPYE